MTAPKTETPHKFENLDALRGIAALIVVTFHANPLFGRRFFPHGYLCVDLFFMLSGFVLAFAYQEKLDRGFATLQFLKLRWIRLYPLYLLALSIGFCYFVLQTKWQHRLHLGQSLLTLLPALIFLPLIPLNSQPALAFPFNISTWSLFSEVVANFAHALFLRKRSTVQLLILLALAAALLCRLAYSSGSLGGGPMRSEIVAGLERVSFSYLAGLLLFRLWKASQPVWSGWFPLASLTLCGLVAIPTFDRMTAVFDLTAVMVFFPLIVIVGAQTKPLPGFRSLANILGTASYAIYVLHMPLSFFFTSAILALWKRPETYFAPWAGICFTFMIVLLALLLDTFFDIPVRRWLRSRLTAKRTTA